VALRKNPIDRIINPVSGQIIKPAANPREQDIRAMERLPILARLDPKKRREAARKVAAVLWGRSISNGRPKGTKKWNDDALFKLGAKLAQVEVENPRVSYLKLAERIKNRWPESYRYDEAANLRKRLPEARRMFESSRTSRSAKNVRRSRLSK
jgi:hypothetical protein